MIQELKYMFSLEGKLKAIFPSFRLLTLPCNVKHRSEVLCRQASRAVTRLAQASTPHQHGGGAHRCALRASWCK